jgi:hypothetical protein
VVRPSMKHVAAAAAVVSATVLGGMVDSAAADIIDFPAGLVCDFAVRLDVDPDTRKVHEITDADGNVEGMLLTGRGSALTLTNVDAQPDISLSLRSNGAVWRIVNNPDGTGTFTTMGHLVLFLFPTDVPAGPSSTLYVGRVVFTFDFETGFTVVHESTGKAADLCAALSG